MNELSSILVCLSRLDAEISVLEAKEKSIKSESEKFEQDCRALENSLNQLNAQHGAALSQQTAEENKLKEEQRKIVERRRQLSALGGSKSAKLLEREVDVAGRAILQLESRVVGMIEELEKVEKRRQDVQNNLEIKQKEKEALTNTWKDMLVGIHEDLGGKRGQREEALGCLTPQIKSTYSRISTRYPGSAVTKAATGTCQSCFRALPAQIFNTVLGGKELVQCPGCSRILVSAELFEAPVSSE